MSLIKEISDYRSQIKVLKTMKTKTKKKTYVGSKSNSDAAATVSEETLRIIQTKRDELGELRQKLDILKKDKAFALASNSMRNSISREKLPPMDGISPRLPEINPASM